MRKTITTILTAMAMLFAISANAQKTFTGAVEQYLNDSYKTSSITFSLTEIATALDTDTATLVAALDTWYSAPKENTSMFFDAANDTTYSDNYTQGTAGGFWMDAYSVPMSWGAGCAWFNKLGWSVEDDEFVITVGQYPGLEPNQRFSTTFVMEFNDKKVNFDISLTTIAKPEIDVTPILSKLTVVGSTTIDVHQYVRGGYNSDVLRVSLTEASEKLGLQMSALSEFLDDYLYCKAMSTDINTEDLASDTLTNDATANGVGWWLRGIYDEDTGELTGECASATYSSSSLFFAEQFTVVDDSLQFYVGQYPNAFSGKEEQTFYVYVYLLNGTNAYCIRINLIIDAREAIDPDKLEKVGEQEYNIAAEVNNNYNQTRFDFDMDAILEALGCTIDDLLDVYSWADEGEMSNNHTESSGGFYYNDEGYICSWGTSASFFIALTSNFKNPKYGIGQMANHFSNIEEPQTVSAELIFKFEAKYYVVKVNYTVKPVGWKEPGEEEEEVVYNLLATLRWTKQMQPAGYYEWDIKDTIDVENIKNILGADSYDVYTDYYKKVSDTDSALVWSDTNTMGHGDAGFWWGSTNYEYEGMSVVSNDGWSPSGSNTSSFGIEWLNTGVVTFYQIPDFAKVGDVYNANLYFASETKEGKVTTFNYIRYILTVKYVEEIVPEAKTIATFTLNLPARDPEDAENGMYTPYDLTPMYEAFGCTPEEFEENGTWMAIDKDGLMSNNFDELEGFALDKDGKLTDDDTDLVAKLGYVAEESAFFSWILDNENLSKTYTFTIYAYYDNQRCEFSITIGDAAAINFVEANKTDGKMFDLTGRLVKNATRGIYIKDGKKFLVK